MLNAIASRLAGWFNTGRPLTQGYDPGPSALVYANWSRRPPWSYYYADVMLLDPQVWFGLQIGNGPLRTAKVEVKCDSREIAHWVQAQWERIWHTSAPQILRAKNYGFLACEVICQESPAGLIEFDRMRDFHPMDVGQLKINGARVGIRVRNIHSYGRGVVDLMGPKGLWLTYGEEFSRTWGRAILERCYAPWFDKNSDGGAYDLRRLRMYKDAWIGDRIGYPIENFRLPNGSMASGRDLAREIAELRMSGGCVVLPTTTDDKGNRKFTYDPPSPVGGEDLVQPFIADLDWDILDGLLVPREVVEAGGQGGGWSGRSVPLLGFLAVRDVEFGSYVQAITAQLLKPLVYANFGRRATNFDIQPLPLIETMGDQAGGMGKPDLTKSDVGTSGDDRAVGGRTDKARPAGDDPALLQLSIDDQGHEHAPAGSPEGGRFVPKGRGEESAKENEPGPVEKEQPHPHEIRSRASLVFRQSPSSKKLLRRLGVRAKDIPSLIGAPDDAVVHAEFDRWDGMIDATISEPRYSLKRRFGIDEDGRKFIENDNFEIHPDHRGGTGLSIFAKQVHHATQAGFSYIKAYAARSPTYNGYYTWAVFGYDQDIDKLGAGLRDAIRRQFPSANTIQDVLDEEDGREWWKTHGGAFEGVFDLTPGSRSQQVLARYIKSKRPRHA
ncbi:MAG TPA: hypothetical protein VHC22_32470 [Pirellulales bacterium]|nr:hypothetical protein [Pirellulales bacterium]